MDDETESCPYCSAELRLADRKGAIDVFTCVGCGAEIVVHNIFPPPERDGAWVKLSVVLADGQPAGVHARAIRDFFPEYRDRPLGELLEKLRSVDRLEIGTYPRPYAQGLQQIAAQKGITLELEVVPDPGR